MLTAAHCFESNNETATFNNIDSKKIIRHADFVPTKAVKHDLAVVIFPAGTAPGIVKFGTVRPKIHTVVTAFSRQGDQKRDPTGSDHKVESTSALGTVFLKADKEITVPGDSGGPLLMKGELIGILGGGVPLKSSEDHRAESSYANLFLKSSIAFLKKAAAQGADIPGISRLVPQSFENYEFETMPNTDAAFEKCRQKPGGGLSMGIDLDGDGVADDCENFTD